MNNIIWIGHRESEILKAENFVNYSITTWGSNRNNNLSYCHYYSNRNVSTLQRNSFIIHSLKKIFKENKDCKVMCYAQTLAYKLLEHCPELVDKFVCLNPQAILELLNNKINTRLWLSSYIPVLKFAVLSGKDCTMEYIHTLFNEHDCYIIQEISSSGGQGTYWMNNENCTEIYNNFKDSNSYIVSYYANPSYSLNIHILISANDVFVFPGSVQIIEKKDNKLIYSGADFVNYSHMQNDFKNKVYQYSQTIGGLLKGIGYKGVCGIDFLVYEDKIYFVEINPRFQASTLLLNLALNSAGLPSMQELQFLSFCNENLPLKEKLEGLNVNFSLYKYQKESRDNSKQYLRKLTLLEKSPDVENILYDGFMEGKLESGTYLYQTIFSRNITSCGNDYSLHLHPNIPMQCFLDGNLPLSHTFETMIRLKISLLNQGVRISSEAYSEMNKYGGYNKSVFNSIDLVFFHYLRINAPVNINLSSLSPFLIDFIKSKYFLLYYNNIIAEIELEFSKSFRNLKTQNGIPYELIAFISGDRLRIKPESRCFFKAHDIGCKFCPGNSLALHRHSYLLADIKEVINYCIDNENFRHILIGGGSANPSSDENKIIPIIKYIRSKTQKPIYLMCLPPNDINYINKYIEAGVNEIAFNIELYDRDIALEYMPGKGKITLEEYLSKLERATSLISQKGNVRSMLMAGLEKQENTLAAVELLAQKGIQPMISIFRPTPKCKLSHIIQPSNEEIYSLFIKADKICKQYNLTLGPSCPSCQNNTLAITLKQI